MAFTIYPSIVLRHGRAVVLEGGDPKRVVLERPDSGDVAQEFRDAGATWLHVVDHDAATGGKPQWSRLGGILGVPGLRVQFGGGVRSMTQVQQLLDLGIDRVVLGTQAVRNPQWVREVCRIFPGRIALALDHRGGDVSLKGWTDATGLDVAAVAVDLDDAGLAAIVATDIDREASVKGLDRAAWDVLRDAVRKTPLVARGGIASDADLDWLAAQGFAGAVVGHALYTRRVGLEELVRRHPQERGHVRAVPEPGEPA